MSSGRGDGKNLPSDLYVTMADIDVNRLHEIDIGLHNRLVEMCRYYDLNCFRFDQYAKLHWNRTYAPTPVHLLQMKKPIMPNRWISEREGWSSEAWGFTNADLTPYMIEEVVAKMMEAFRQPNYKEVFGEITLPEGFKLPEVDK